MITSNHQGKPSPNLQSILSIFYGDPDLYPPMINVAHLFHDASIEYRIVSRLYPEPILPIHDKIYPENTVVARIRLLNSNTLIQYLQFVILSLINSSRSADIIIGYDMHGLIPARLLTWLMKIPLVYHCHDYAENGAVQTFGGRVVKWLERRFARTADLVIVPDCERAAVMVEQLHLKRDPIVVANAPLKQPDPSPILRNTLTTLGKSFSRIVFRQGRIGPNHALDVTLRSMPMWADPSWGFVIMGPADSSYRDYLYDLAASLGVADRFVILPAVPYPQVAHYTVGADLGHGLYEFTHFNHIHFTTASNKIMEFIAAGLPVLLPDSSGSRSLLEKYRVGTTADVNSPSSVAAAVNSVLGDPHLAAKMRAESRRAFSEEFNYMHQYTPIIERLQQLVSERKAPSPRYKLSILQSHSPDAMQTKRKGE